MLDYRQIAIQYVLEAFLCMGATPEQLEAERARLSTDDKYLDEWSKVTGFYETSVM